MSLLRIAPAALSVGFMFSLTACSLVPYGDQLPMTPDIPRETSTNDIVVPKVAPCPVMNSDAPTTSVTYTNSDKGISFDIPYNPSWGSEGKPLPAFTEHAATDSQSMGYVVFGPPMSAGLEGLETDCDLMQSYSLSFLPARTPAQITKTLGERGLDVVPDTTVRTINGLTVVQYIDAGLCSFPTMEVLGKTYNYSFTTNCGTDDDVSIAYLENIIKSLKLTK